jgi:hypothetical protein
MFIRTIFALLAIWFATYAVGGTANVFFPDPGLENCVRQAIEKPSGELTVEDVSSLTHLECRNRNIWNIDGIENLEALTKLSFWENHIRDLSPLNDLTSLTWLQLGNNEIEDLSPLSNLINLTRLGLALNNIEDVSVMEGLTALKWLNLDNNRLANDNLHPLCSLDGLTWLTLEHNRLTSISDLDCIARKGFDIYWELQDTLSSAATIRDLRRLNKEIAPDVPPESSSPDFHPLIDGDLVAHVDPDGAVSFRYMIGNHDFPVINEYSGTIFLEGSTFAYHTKGSTLDIGVMTDDGFVICSEDYAAVCSLTIGKKGAGYRAYDDSNASKSAPVITVALTIIPTLRPGSIGTTATSFVDSADTFLEAYDLSPYALASPNQLDAGSCLSMATAGAMEILMNQRLPLDQIIYKGGTDLSERYLMNVVTDVLPDGVAPYYLTDTIYTYNFFQGSMLDLDYPFIVDFDLNGNLTAEVNWENGLPINWQDMLVTTPAAERTVIFADPLRDDKSKWRVAIADQDVVDIIKYELASKNAPVVIVYNHFNYWHSDIIVGYDDNHASGGCPMVIESLKYYFRTRKFNQVVRILSHMRKLRGCLDKGVFYVRDSIYDGGPDEPDYVYNDEIPYVGKYSKRIIERSYNWVLYLANHGYAIHRQK